MSVLSFTIWLHGRVGARERLLSRPQQLGMAIRIAAKYFLLVNSGRGAMLSRIPRVRATNTGSVRVAGF